MNSCVYCSGQLSPFAQFGSDRVVDVMLTPQLQQQLPELCYGKCDRCGSLIATDARLGQDLDLLELYEQLPADYWTGLETGHGPDFFRLLEQRLNPQQLPLQVGDVGCGAGGILRGLGSHWHKTGLEPGLAAISQPQGKINPDEIAPEDMSQDGIHWIRGSLGQSGLVDGYFDVLLYVDVFEHLADPLGEMALARRYLKPGGQLVIYTGDASAHAARLAGGNWAYLRCAGHVAVASRQALVQGLAQAGFELTALLGQNHPSSPGLGKWLFEYLGSRLRRHWAVPLLQDHLLAIAQRP